MDYNQEMSTTMPLHYDPATLSPSTHSDTPHTSARSSDALHQDPPLISKETTETEEEYRRSTSTPNPLSANNDPALHPVPVWERGDDIGSAALFRTQLGATIKRILIMKKRSICSLSCEILAPLIFIIVTVLIGISIEGGDYAEVDYLNMSKDSVSHDNETYVDFKSLNFCYNSTERSSLNGMPPCKEDVVDTLLCARDHALLSGLCYKKSVESRFGRYKRLFSLDTEATVLPTFDQMAMVRLAHSITRRDEAAWNGWKLYFTPVSPATAALVKHLESTTELFRLVYDGTFDKATIAERILNLHNDEALVWGVVQVDEMSPSRFDVTIRMNTTATPPSYAVLSRGYSGGYVNEAEKYMSSGFLSLQHTISEYYLNVVKKNAKKSEFIFVPTPTAAYKVHPILQDGKEIIAFIIVLGFLYPVLHLTKLIVTEKELKISEAVLIMGLRENVTYISLFIVYAVEYLIVSAVAAVMIQRTYLKDVSYVLIFLLIFLYSLSTIALSFMFAALFNKARMAGFVTPLIYLGFSFTMFLLALPFPGSAGLMLFPPVTFSVGLSSLFRQQLSGVIEIFAVGHIAEEMGITIVFLVMLLDTAIYLLLAGYLNAVVPKEWGTTRHPFFCIINPLRRICSKNPERDIVYEEDGRSHVGVFEEVLEEENIRVQLMGIRKTFYRGKEKFIAVNNLYWSMREGEISVLLGHNGAGKSTALNMMTGMIKPDGGDCLVYGRSVRYELAAARQEMGFCPQHNVLWPTLTCREHLEYYAAIKGLKGQDRRDVVEDLLEAVDLDNEKDYRSSYLSGGQKRKLSVGIAFVGQGRLIFLDEPTAGMDVGARRHTHNLLKRMSSNRTILLTTHFMDEADSLGSNIAIVNHGRLQCSGSNMFLKSKLGEGYLITLSVIPHVDRSALHEFIRTHVSSAKPVGSGAGEAAFCLPMFERHKFASLLKDIEDLGMDIGVKSYSISASTLEEIFLKLAEGNLLCSNTKNKKNDHDDNNSDTVPPGHSVWNVNLMETEFSVMRSQFRVMLLKRYWIAFRDKRTIFFQILFPVISVLLSLCIPFMGSATQPNLLLNSNVYGRNVEIPVMDCENFFNPSIPLSSNTRIVPVSGVKNATELSAYLLSTHMKHTRPRYGAISCNDSSMLPNKVVIFFNSTSYHEPAIGMANYFAGLLLNTDKSVEYKMNTYPLPPTNYQTKMSAFVWTWITTVVLMIPFSMLTSTYALWIVKERECRARHLQNVSGLRYTVYWISNFLFDLAMYFTTTVLMFILFSIFQYKEFIALSSIVPLFSIFMLYGASGIAFTYSLSFIFSHHVAAQSVLMIVNFVAGFLAVMVTKLLSIFESTGFTATIMVKIFRIFPSFCFGEILFNRAWALTFGNLDETPPWDMDMIGWPCVYMVSVFVACSLLTLALDNPRRRKFTKTMFSNPDRTPEHIQDEDDDVKQEREEVLHSEERMSDLVTLQYLRKRYYNGNLAVRNLTLGVKSGEVFGFLGTNGAGKTTTMSILCQEIFPSSGHAWICGYDIVKESDMAMRSIGYCPQFDACLDLLTVEEHLQLYAGLRGIEYDCRRDIIEGLMDVCQLTEYQDSLSCELSGGNRRKLSVATALVGGPRVVLLDEPSAGMDPLARRALWNVIEAVADNCSVMLTTHHLEEVEALAHRVAIMVDGTLRCIGDKTHLKNKYGSGYEVTVRMESMEEMSVERAVMFFTSAFPNSRLEKQRADRLTFTLPSESRLSMAFDILERNSSAMGFIDYHVSQTTLEQVFLRISEEAERAREQSQFNMKTSLRSKFLSLFGNICSQND